MGGINPYRGPPPAMNEADAEVIEKAHQLINRLNNLVNAVGWQAAQTNQKNGLHHVRRVLVKGV